MFSAIKRLLSRLVFWRKKPVAKKWSRTERKVAAKPKSVPMQQVGGRVSAANSGNQQRPMTARNQRRLEKKLQQKGR